MGRCWNGFGLVLFVVILGCSGFRRSGFWVFWAFMFVFCSCFVFLKESRSPFCKVRAEAAFKPWVMRSLTGPQKSKRPGRSEGPGRRREEKKENEKEKMMERREREKEKVRRLITKPKEVEKEKEAWNKANGWSGGRRQGWRHGRMTDGWLMKEGMRSWQEIQPLQGQGTQG